MTQPPVPPFPETTSPEVAVLAPSPRPPKAASKRERTCVGCGDAVDLDEGALEPGIAPSAEQRGGATLLRVALAEADGAWTCVVDAPANLGGRGAWVHAAPKCLQRACKGGFSKALKTKVDLPLATLVEAGQLAAERRMEGLLASARRGRLAAFGHDACRELLAKEPDALLVVATDAGAIARSREVEDAVRLGRAVAWATKRRLGVFFGKEEVALVAIADPRMSVAIVRAVADRAAFAACSVEPKGSETTTKSTKVEGEACRSPEVR